MAIEDRRISLEFFPPKTAAGKRRFGKVLSRLSPLQPSFASVTFGAGGSTREGSFETAAEIVRTTGLKVTPHLSCIGSNVEQLGRQLELYREIGVRHVLALRGDPPEGQDAGDGSEPYPQAFPYADGLVKFIRDFGGFRISVACYPEFHPESSAPEHDMQNFVRKVKAGADEAITQYFFNNDAYYRFVEWAQRLGVDIPIVPGLMPITDFRQVERFSGFCGADIPRWLRLRMEALENDPKGQSELGIELAARQAEELLRNGAPGLHIYTLNRSEATLRLWDHLGLPRSATTHSPAMRTAP
ncbi:MAG: methylenetetrahydrofolate reductase [NAD(P)H] [Myxococcales bacterium]|nr:methylenetetrahydrofolate reductase [NAD(P)H] [Myxococcales bacterium]